MWGKYTLPSPKNPSIIECSLKQGAIKMDIRIGGLFRCCVETAQEQTEAKEGDVLHCKYYKDGQMIFKDLAYEWLQEPPIKQVIGKKCRKSSGLPFKSTFRINTIKGMVDHPILHVPAYTFVEDDSYVESHKCTLID
jgi:hypothetical protein